jgi:hypothetical protein
MKNTISTTTPTLENLKRELALANAEWTRQLMGSALGPIRVARNRYEAILAQIAEEERQIAYHNSLRTAWVGNLDHQRLAHDAMGGL